MTWYVILQVILLGIGLSADAFSVALTDGLTYTDINKKRSFFIAGAFGVMQALMPLLGFWIVEAVERIAGEVAGAQAGVIAAKIVVWVAFGLLLFIGVKMLVESILEMRRSKEEKKERKFSVKEVLFYSFATAVDALAAGVTLHAGLSSVYSIWLHVSIVLVLTFSISSRRALLIAANSSSRSIPRKRRPSRLAAMPVVLLPANGSRIHAPALVDAKMIRLSTPNGFWVGCFVHVFSQGAMAGRRQTSVICLSPLMCFINS